MKKFMGVRVSPSAPLKRYQKVPAVEVINPIKALDPTERAKVMELLPEIAPSDTSSQTEEIQLKDSINRVFAHHADLLQRLAQ